MKEELLFYSGYQRRKHSLIVELRKNLQGITCYLATDSVRHQ